MKPEDIINLTPIKWVHKGFTLAYHEGKPIFCTGGVPNIRSEFIIEKVNSKHAYARASEIISDCSVFPICGGCSYRHISYEEELKIKSKEAEETLLNAIPNLNKNQVRIHVISGSPYHYRNNVQWKKDKNSIGFYKRFSNEVVSLIGIGCKNLNPLLPLDPLDPKFPLYWRISYINDNKFQPVPYKEKETHYIFKGKKFTFPPGGFMQINTELMEKWIEVIQSIAYRICKDYGKLTWIELFCGAGIIGQSISEYVKELIGFEQQDSSVEYAKTNAFQNSIKNFIYKKIDLYKEKLDYQPKQNLWVLILNPPRAGIGKLVIQWIQKSNPNEVIYSSCDVHTLARDLKILLSKMIAFEIKEIFLFDFFPRTSHFETLVWIGKKDSHFKNTF